MKTKKKLCKTYTLFFKAKMYNVIYFKSVGLHYSVESKPQPLFLPVNNRLLLSQLPCVQGRLSKTIVLSVNNRLLLSQLPCVQGRLSKTIMLSVNNRLLLSPLPCVQGRLSKTTVLSVNCCLSFLASRDEEAKQYCFHSDASQIHLSIALHHKLYQPM